MISKNLLDFLVALKENNNREWFASNKSWYDKSKKELDVFIEKVIVSFGQFDKEIAYLEPRDCTYRIYRDTRFSPDKTPYKTNMGAFFVKGSKNSGNAGYYFHIEPGNIMLAGGVYMPSPEILKKIRTEIYENIDEFIEIVNSKEFVKTFGRLDNEMVLKKTPKDFPGDFEHIEYLKYKSYTVSTSITENVLHSDNLIVEIIRVFKTLQPFNKFLNDAILNN